MKKRSKTSFVNLGDAIGSLKMRLAESMLVTRDKRGRTDPRTGKVRMRLDTTRTMVPRPTESMKLKTDTVLNLKDYMGDLPDKRYVKNAEAKARLKKVAPAFAARARGAGADGVAAIRRVTERVHAADFPGALALVQEFMGLKKGGDWARLSDVIAKARTVQVPHSSSPVVLQPPKRKRKRHPFQGFVDFQGIKIDVENKRGSRRKGTGEDGTPWDVKMHHHYGEIRGTEGTDGDLLDAYVGPNADAPLVVVVHQQDPKTKAYDEDKVMLGFDSAAEALRAYRGQYDSPGFYGGHTTMNIGAFWRWVHDEKKRGQKVRVSLRAPVKKAGRMVLKAGGPYIGPRGGKWADPQHTIPWKQSKQRVFVPKKVTPAPIQAKPTTLKAYLDGGGSVKELSKMLQLSKLPATGGKNPVDPASVVMDLSGDIHSKAILKWKDAKGRSQSAYTETFVQRNAAKKWGRVAAFRKFIPKAKVEAVSAVSDQESAPRSRDAAAIVAIIAETGLRPGSKASVSAEGHYGISTLRAEHVSFSGKKAQLTFVGKSGKTNTTDVTEPAVVAWMKERHASAGERGGSMWEASDSDARDAFKAIGGGAFKLKDFRTAKASEIAARELLSITPPPPLPRQDAAARKMLLQRVRDASVKVASALNNTPAIARKSYIMPSVIDEWAKQVGGERLMKGDAVGALLDRAERRMPPVDNPGPVSDEAEDEDESLEQYTIPAWLKGEG